MAMSMPPSDPSRRSLRAVPLLLVMCLVLEVLAGCAGLGGGGRRQRLSFSEMQALNPGVQGAWVLDRFPYAQTVSRRSDGSLQRLVYAVEDPNGSVQDVILDFDGRGVLMRKQYNGAFVRPPMRVE